MAITLDHLMIPSQNRDAAAERLASILGVEWGAANVGPFTAVYVNAELTIDFDEWQEDFPKGHYCFHVDDSRFDEVLSRIQRMGIGYRSHPHGANDGKVNTSLSGKIIYWDEPDGHVWELLTKSYARNAK